MCGLASWDDTKDFHGLNCHARQDSLSGVKGSATFDGHLPTARPCPSKRLALDESISNYRDFSDMALYRPLNPFEADVRLLWLLCDEPMLSFELATRSLDAEPAYTALSYTWDTEPADKAIIVNGQKSLVQ